MKKLGLFLSIVMAHTIHTSEIGYTQSYNKTPHQIYVGPELFCYSIHIPIEDIEVSNSLFFGGIKIGYEYLKPWSCYAGLEISSAASSHHFEATQNSHPLPHSNTQGFGTFELRLGYTLASQNTIFTPFVSFGGYGITSKQHNRFQEVIEYLSLNLRSITSINDWCGVGLSAKIFKSVYSKEQYRTNHTKVKDSHRYWGGELALPIMIHPLTHCDLQFEPYFLDLTFGQKQLLFGSRFLIGVRF